MSRLTALHFGKFYPPHRGGMELMVATLCRGLVRRGVGCRVVVAADGRTAREALDQGVRVSGLRSLGTVLSTPICPAAAWALRGVQADVVNLHHPNPLADLSCALSQFDGRLVVTYHSDVVRQRRAGRLHALLLHRTLGRADAIVVTSPQYAESSVPLRPFRRKVQVIPLGLPSVPEVRTRPPFGAGEPRYLFVGRLVPYKGLPVLLEALRRARGRLWIIGSGPLEEALRRQAAEPGLADRVEFLGALSERAKWERLAACDALVLPSVTRAEAFGLVLLEAMAMARPIVVSDLPTGVRMLVRERVNGLRVPPGDPGALAEALEALASDPLSAQRMGRQGRRMFRQRWTADHMIERYVDLYEELCGVRAATEARCAS